MELDENNKVIKDEVLIEALYIGEGESKVPKKYEKLIRQATPVREWLNEKGQEYAYHCIPLTSASSLGYWILSNSDVTVYWDGGGLIESVKIKEENRSEEFDGTLMAHSHFVKGVITYTMPFIFKTPPGWGLYVGPCPNYPIDGLQGLEAIIETNWLPFSFTMNFKITEPNKIIKIPKGTPVCRIYPFPLNLNEKTKCEIKPISTYPEFEKSYREYTESRLKFNKDLMSGKLNFSNPSDARQKFYKNGTDARGNVVSKGFHKLDYKYPSISAIPEDQIKKCPFLSYALKIKNIFKNS